MQELTDDILRMMADLGYDTHRADTPSTQDGLVATTTIVNSLELDEVIKSLDKTLKKNKQKIFKLYNSYTIETLHPDDKEQLQPRTVVRYFLEK